MAPGLLEFLRDLVGTNVDGTDVMAYVAGVISHGGYWDTFRDALRQPGVRVPLTAVPGLWREAVAIGKGVIWLHTYGERPTAWSVDTGAGVTVNRPAILEPIPGGISEMPDTIEYDNSSFSVIIGGGRIGPVLPDVWNYQVSGMHVVRHWFDYRRRSPRRRRSSSELDNITADRWTLGMTEQLRDLLATLDGCVSLERVQKDLLGRIMSDALVTNSDLRRASIVHRRYPHDVSVKSKKARRCSSTAAANRSLTWGGTLCRAGAACLA